MLRATAETSMEADDDGLDLLENDDGLEDENIGAEYREIYGLTCKGEANFWEALSVLIITSQQSWIYHLVAVLCGVYIPS